MHFSWHAEKQILERGPCVLLRKDVPGVPGVPLRLCLASARGDAQGAAHWIQYGEVDWRDTAASRSTALMYAAAAGHADVAMALLKARACPLLLDAQQRSAAELTQQAEDSEELSKLRMTSQ